MDSQFIKKAMSKKILVGFSAVSFLFCLNSCQSGTSSNDSIATDSLTIAAGERSFNINCSGCHNFRQDAIGPQLSGLTNDVSAEWIKNFIKDPRQLINSKDDHAIQLHAKYKTIMPPFSWLKEDEIRSIIAFIHSHKENRRQEANENDNALSNPIPEPIKLSDVIADLQLVTQIPASSDSGKAPLARITEMKIQPGTNDLFVVDLIFDGLSRLLDHLGGEVAVERQHADAVVFLAGNGHVCQTIVSRRARSDFGPHEPPLLHFDELLGAFLVMGQDLAELIGADAQEGVRQRRIELRSRTALNFGHRDFQRQRLAVRAIRRHRIETIGQTDDPPHQRDVLSR